MNGQIDIHMGQMEARTRWNTHVSGAAFDKKKTSYLTEQARAFIAQQAICVIAGLGPHNEPRGLIVPGWPGFVQTPNEHTCLLSLDDHIITSHLWQGLRTSLLSRRVAGLALCFIHHTTRERLCVQGAVEILPADESELPQLCLHVTQAFFHCPKYIRTRIAGLTTEPPSEQSYSSLDLECDGQSSLSHDIRSFIASQVSSFLCTVDCSGRCAVNHRGGVRGFLVAPPPSDAYTDIILLPDYTGNGAFEAIGNILETGRAALLIPGYTEQVVLCITGNAYVVEPQMLPTDLQEHCCGAERIIALVVQHVEKQTGDWSTALAYERARSQPATIEDSTRCHHL